MKNALRDWRLPAIFAVPIVLWAGLLYLILQPFPTSSPAAAKDVGIRGESGIMYVTPRPAGAKPTPYPTVPPKPGDTSVPCAHTAPTVIVVYNSVTHQPINAWVGTVCRP